MGPPTRRHVLLLAAAGLSGCSGDGGDEPTGETPATRQPTATRTTTTRASGTPGTDPTTTDPERTGHGTGGPDERVTAQPPGDRPLPAAGTWPQGGYDAGNTGHASDADGVRDGERYWRLDAGRTAVVGEDGLYNVYQRAASPKRVTVRDPATAEVREETELVEYGVTSPPAVGDRVYVSTFVRPWAIERDGGIAWEGPVVDGMNAPPTLHDGRVHVVGRGFTGRNNPPKAAVLTGGGEVVWESTVEDRTVGAPATDGDRTVVATTAGVIGFDEGDQRWRYDDGNPDGTPVVSDDQVFVPGREQVHALDAADGADTWREGPGGHSLVVTADRVFAGNHEGTVALDRDSGAVAWRESRGGTPLAAAGETLYTAAGRTLVALDLSEGDPLWSYDTPEVRVADQIFGGIAGVTPVDGAVFLRAADALHGIGPADG